MIIDLKEQIWLSHVKFYELQLDDHRHLQREDVNANKEYLRNHRYERTNMAYKCKIFGCQHLMGKIHKCV